MIDPGLKGKVAIVTGANNEMGIGAAVARALSAQGVSVFLTYFRATKTIAALGDTSIPGEAMYRAQRTYTAHNVLQDIEQQGGKAEAMEADLSNPAIILSIFDRAEAAFGPVDVLINNA